MASKRNMFSEISEELGGTLHQAFLDAQKSKTTPTGMKLPTNQSQRDQAWIQRVQTDAEFAKAEFRKDKEAFRKRWEEGRT